MNEARVRTAWTKVQEAKAALIVADAELKLALDDAPAAAIVPAPAPPTAPPAQLPSVPLSNPAAFFDAVRGKLWPKMTTEQVGGCERLMRAGAGRLPLTWMAYGLATGYHETAYTMEPVKERGSHAYLDKYDTGRLAEALGNTPEDDDDGQLYAGRGDVQLTGRRNYRVATQKLQALGILKPTEDMIKTPDLAMRPDVSAAVLVVGMTEGWFTGKKFNDYINNAGGLGQYTNARRIINGTDKAAQIAGYAVKFDTALKAGGWK